VPVPVKSLGAILGQTALTGVIAAGAIGLISVLGFPNQRMLDLGKWLQVRVISGGAGSGAGAGAGAGGGGLAGGGAAQAEKPADTPETDLAMTLGPALFAVAGQPFTLEYDNVILSRDSEQYRFNVLCGTCPWADTMQRRRWAGTPPQPGEHALTVGTVSFDFTRTLAQGATTLRVAPAEALRARPPRLLVFGDSITRQHWWVNGVARRLDAAGVRGWSMIGREYTDGTPPFSEKPPAGVRHEAEYGWSFSFFSSFIAADEAQARAFRRPRSPFVYGESPLAAKLDVPRYYAETSGGQPADFVVMQAGINDIWGVNAEDPVALKQRLDLTMANIKRLVDAFTAAHPGTHVGLILPAPFTRSEKNFNDAYKGAVTRWNARQGQHALVRAMIETFGGKEAERIWLIPLHASFDTVDGYPVDNAGHPNPHGQGQIADAVFAWMSWVGARR
jgi:lysophospholipase L1-like esterase